LGALGAGLGMGSILRGLEWREEEIGRPRTNILRGPQQAKPVVPSYISCRHTQAPIHGMGAPFAKWVDFSVIRTNSMNCQQGGTGCSNFVCHHNNTIPTRACKLAFESSHHRHHHHHPLTHHSHCIAIAARHHRCLSYHLSNVQPASRSKLVATLRLSEISSVHE
jgi:hypothetical protein